MISSTLFFLLIHCAQAQNEVDSLKQLLSTSSSDSARVQLYNELSWYYKNKNADYDSALIFSFKSLEVAKRTNSYLLIAAAQGAIGNAFSTLTKYDSALHYYNLSVALKLSKNDSLGLANVYSNIGIAYDEMGYFEKSLQNYFKGLALAESQNDLEIQAQCLNNIGIVYKKQRQYELVMEYYQRTLIIYNQLNHSFGSTVTQGNLGSVLIQLGAFDRSIEYSKLAIEGYTKLGYERYIPYPIGNMAQAYDSLRQYDKAEEYYLDAFKKHLLYDNKYEAAFNAKNLSYLYLKQNKINLAKAYAQKAIEYSSISNAREMLKDAHLAMALSLAKNGEYKKGFEHQGRYMSLKDSLFEVNQTKTIFELQAQYETEKKEQKIASQRVLLAEEKALNQRNFVFIIALILSLILVLIVVGLLRSRFRKKQQIILQEKDIESKALQLNAVISSQENERKRFATDLHDGFGQMISILKMNIESLNGTKPKQEEREAIFDKSKEMLNEMYDELRGICFNLMPQTLVKQGLIKALDEFASRINVAGQVSVEIIHFDMGNRLDDLQEVSLYRIIQEWINNTLKYSDANHIIIQLTKDENEITLTIEDNGTGFDTKLLTESKGNGWKNMQSRTNLIKGELELDTQVGQKGTMVIVNVPLRFTPTIRASTDQQLQS